jgi:hypothetical protein
MKSHIQRLAHKTAKSGHVRKIRDALSLSKSKSLNTSELRKICGTATGSVYGALYRMALDGEIELYMKKYHVMIEQIFVRAPRPSEKPAYIHRKQWRDGAGKPKQIQLVPPSPTPIKPKQRQIGEMNVDELTKLIEKAEKARLEIMLKERYEGADFVAKSSVCDVLRQYGVADPIALLHLHKDGSFATYTATNDMPIVITIENGGQVKTIKCQHVTLHGTKLVQAIKESAK